MEQDSPELESFTVKSLILMPFGCLIKFSAHLALVILLVLIGGGYYVFEYVNVDFFGIGTPDYSQMKIDDHFNSITIGKRVWTFSYESYTQSRYNGRIRHISPIRMDQYPFLTHDVLVTSGDFADEKKVTTSVSNHRFEWRSLSSQYPQGKINLIHAVPQNEAIYRQLLSVQSSMEITISGFEIQKINLLGGDGKPSQWWQDAGCNTLLVTKINIQQQ